ncbi:hypothetical protein IT408_04355 [Candidatus Uhrbacteria bacterium]|nr:hypothetical protein [Candidatus Uhrbacteria bacterium]
MSSFESWWKRFLPLKKVSPIDRYRVDVVTSSLELTVAELVPLEIRYALALRPMRFEIFRKLLDEGYGIGVRVVEKTPERVLHAVDRISRYTQHNTILPWLEILLREEKIPIFTTSELESAEKAGVFLYEEIKIILEKRFEFRKIVIVDLHNHGVGDEQRRFMQEVNEDIFPLAIDAIVHRVMFDNAHSRTAVAQTIIKSLIFIGPCAHALEHVLSGLGKVFAASADDILAEVAELFALRGSGFTWRQLAIRGKILIPVFILATIGAFQVEPMIRAGHVGLAGVVFGLSAVALSLTTAVQSIFLYKHSYESLVRENKLQLLPGQSVIGFALKQDFTNPARLGLFIGAICSPLMAAFVFSSFTHLVENGWILALLGSVESLVAGAVVTMSTSFEKSLFRYKLRRALGETLDKGRMMS